MTVGGMGFIPERLLMMMMIWKCSMKCEVVGVVAVSITMNRVVLIMPEGSIEIRGGCSQCCTQYQKFHWSYADIPEFSMRFWSTQLASA